MKRLLFLLMLVAISPAMGMGDDFVGIGNTDIVDDFQHHPGLDATDVWNTTDLADAPLTFLIQNYPVSYSQSLSIKAPATGRMKPKIPLSAASSYWAYTVRSGTNTTTCANVITINQEKFLNSSGGVVASIDPNIGHLCPPGLYEYVVSGSIVRLYINGVDVYNTTITEIPTNIRIYEQNNLYKDDVHTTTGIIGMQERFTEAENDIQVSYAPYIKYAYPGSSYEVDVISLSNGQVHNSTPVTNFSGFVVWDRQSTLAYNYDAYRVRLLKDGSQEAFHDFFYVPSAIYGTIIFTEDQYMQGDPMNFTYTLITPAFLTYSYRAVLTTTSGTVVGTVSLDDLSGSNSFDSTGLAQGTYYGLLQRKCVAGCTSWELLNYDIAGVLEGFNVHGYTYDAMNGTILPSTDINISQSDGTWFNTTSNATTGYYNLSGLLTISTTFNASKINYTHEAFTVSPTFPGNRSVNFYLWPSNLSHTNTTIQGLTVDYPYHQPVPSATVNVYNASFLNTSTSNSWGYYQAEVTASTYSVNATKSGYRASSVYSVTPVLNEWKVQNLVLHPIYNITIYAKDSVTLAYISSFATQVNGVLYQTTNGSVAVQLEYGTYSISTSAQGYYGNMGSINVDSDATETVLLAPFTTTTNTNNNVDFISTQVYEKFIVRGLFDNPYPGLTLEVFNGSSDTVSFSGTTDSMGQVVFKLTKDVYYRGELTGSTIDPLIFYFYGKEESYLITIMTGFPSGGDRFSDIHTNLTVLPFNATYSNLSVIYNDTIASTTAVNFYAKNLTTNATCTRTSALSVVQLNCTVLARGTYQFGYNATSSVYGFFREDKIINFGAGNTSSSLVPTKPPTATTGANTTIVQWGSIMLIVLTASLFSIKTLKLGAVIVPAEALILWVFGWLSADWKLLAIAMVIGVLIYMRMSESKVAYQ